jgi:lipopolysaccharide transport system permease protein
MNESETGLRPAKADVIGTQFGVTAGWPETLIQPSEDRLGLPLRDVWAHRRLIALLIWRDIKVRYKQTAVGAAWAVLQPLLTMVVLTALFGRLMDVPTDGVPYAIFAYTALVPWTYFVHALTKCTISLVDNYGLITKVYFPRLVIPIGAVLAGLVDFAIAFAILLIMMAAYGIAPTAAFWTLPLFLLLGVAAALGAGLWLTALNVRYRDVANALPFLTQLLFFVTPVAYPSSLIPQAWQGLYALNPMAGVVEGFRWALLGNTQAPSMSLAISALAVVGLLVGGAYFFRHQERRFADII